MSRRLLDTRVPLLTERCKDLGQGKCLMILLLFSILCPYILVEYLLCQPNSEEEILRNNLLWSIRGNFKRHTEWSTWSDVIIYIILFTLMTLNDYFPSLIHRLSKIMTWICCHIYSFLWENYTSMAPNFNSALPKPSLKLWHGWLITSHSFAYNAYSNHSANLATVKSLT